MTQRTFPKHKDTFNLVKNASLFDIVSNRIRSEHNGATVIIPHVCNNINAFGGGFAGQVSQLYPVVKANFHMLGNQAKLGNVQFINVESDKKYGHSIIFANMIAQNNLISEKNKRPLNYAALVYCMNQVKSYTKQLQSSSDMNRIELHCPKFGSGLAGGNWNFISDLINDIWYDMGVFVYVL
jgi:hypothetical protein